MGGGGPICYMTLYDEFGYAYESLNYFSTSYLGEAPLYAMNNAEYCKLDSNRCYECPDSLPRNDVAFYGKPVYPLVLTAQLSENWMAAGESDVLVITASFDGEYKDEYDGPMQMVEIEPDTTMNVQLVLQAPKFDINIAQKDTFGKISLVKDMTYKWIVSPKESALGDQVISAVLYNGGERLNEVFIRLEVRSLHGLNPVFLSVMTAVSVFLAGLVKPVFDMIKSFFSDRKSSPKTKKKKSKKKKK